MVDDESDDDDEFGKVGYPWRYRADAQTSCAVLKI